MRLAVQQELAHVKQQAAGALELVNAKVEALESQLAAARSKTQFAEASADMARKEITTLTAQLAAARAEAKDLAGRVEAGDKVAAQLTLEVAAERSAYTRLEQLWAVEAKKSQAEVEQTREHLHVQREQALQANKESQTSEHARSAEQTARRHTEEMLELERAARRAVEEQLAVHKADVVPALERTVQERTAELAAVQRELAAARERLQRLEIQESENARRLHALNEALAAAEAGQQHLTVENLQLREAMDAQAQRDRQLRLKLEHDVEMLQRALEHGEALELA